MTKHQNLTSEAFALRLDAAEQAVTFARAQLAEAATAGHRSDDLHDRVQAIARAEVVRDLERHAANVAGGHTLAPAGSPVEALQLVARGALRQLVQQGADDTWSGRANDLRRVRHDALRRWVADIADLGDD